MVFSLGLNCEASTGEWGPGHQTWPFSGRPAWAKAKGGDNTRDPVSRKPVCRAFPCSWLGALQTFLGLSTDHLHNQKYISYYFLQCCCKSGTWARCWVNPESTTDVVPGASSLRSSLAPAQVSYTSHFRVSRSHILKSDTKQMNFNDVF